MGKKTFEISNIQSVEELNNLSVTLNEQEQVSHIKVNKESVVFKCIDIEVLMTLIQAINKELVVKEVIDGIKREYDFAKRNESEHYFMFKNMLSEDDIYVLVDKVGEDNRYRDVGYDKKNKVLTLVSSQRDVLSYLRKELFKINPSIEILEHRKPIRSQDVFNQKFLKMYARIAIFLVVVALALITSKDKNTMTPILWLLTMILLSEKLIIKSIQEIKHKNFFKEDVLFVVALFMGLASGFFVETCIASVIYQLASPLINKVLERSLNKIDETVKMPELGTRVIDGIEEMVSLYDFEIGDTMIVYPGETIHIPGVLLKGPSKVSTYSNTSVYELVRAKKGTVVNSGDINVGDNPVYVKVKERYEGTNFVKLMNIASVAPVYETKIEKYTNILSRFYTPTMLVLGIVLGIVLPFVNFAKYSTYMHAGAILLVLSGALSSSQSTSLGMLAGFAKAFKEGIIVESSLGLDSINATQTIVYDRFDGMEVTEEELELFKKLSHIGRTLVIFNDGPVALENDQYTIYNDLTVEEKLEKMDSLIGPIVYIGDSFKDIALLQKSFVGISRGGLSDHKVVENSDIVLIDASLDKVSQTFKIARNIRTTAIANNIFTILMKFAILIPAVAFAAIPLWVVVVVEMLVSMFVMYNSTHILE
ncbi:MAG: hypothetical protein RR585_11440 [Coprobacillus sp.]